MGVPFRDLIPPAALKAARTVRAVLNGSSLPQQTFATYAEAAAQCQQFGYEMADLVEVVYQKTVIYRAACKAESPGNLTAGETLALFALGLAHTRSAPINVIDFGGACGSHFFRLKSLLGDGLPVRWHVVETPAMARRARVLASAELQFFESLTAAVASLHHVDIMFSSGTLQYVSDPLKTMNQLLACNAKYVALARLGLTQGRSMVAVQQSRLSDNGPGPLPPGLKDGISRYPVTYVAETLIESALKERYRVLLRLPDPSVSAHGSQVFGVGYVAESRQPGN
jgi:putative methyltransferase (TIGR04325 family)